MGTPEFARISLEAVYSAKFSIVGVFSQPDKPAGRGRKISTPPCAVFAAQHGIPLHQPEDLKDPEVIRQIHDLRPDFIVTVAYGKFLPEEILAAPKMASVNLHASLLPKYRGAAPVQWAIIRGEKETGVTVMKMSKKMDAGPVYSQKKIPVDPSDTSATLSDKLAGTGAVLLLETILRIADGALLPLPQDETRATFAPLIGKEDGKILWDTEAGVICNLVRGLNPRPSAHTFIDNKMLKIYDSIVLNDNTEYAPGTIYLVGEKGICVACRNSSLCLVSVQLEGKNRIPANDFARGFRLKEGTVLG